MIIREWDGMTSAEKNNLEKIYRERKMLTNEDIDSSEAYRRAQVAEKQLREVARR